MYDPPTFDAPLRQRPFGEVADPDLFYASPVHEIARARLFAAVQVHQGLILLTGEPGTGKTMVLRRVTRDVERSGGRVLRCDDPAVLDRRLASFVRQLGVLEATAPQARGEASVAVEAVSQGGATLVAVDEAQRLRPAEIARLRELVDVCTDAGLPMAVLLVGQPNLAARLAHPDRQDDAPPLRLDLSPLPASEVGPYVVYQLDKAGECAGAVFESEAIERVAAHANGIPRVINNLCAAALRAASQADATTVSASIVDGAARHLRAPFGDRTASLDRRGTRQVLIARDRGAFLGHRVARQLHIVEDRAASFGHHGAYLLHVARDRATSLGYHGVYLLCVAQDRATSLGHHGAYLLHVARDRATSLGYHGVYLLCVAQDRAASFGHHAAYLLHVARDRAASLGYHGAHLLHVARDRATSLGYHGVHLLCVAQDRAASLGHQGAYLLHVTRDRATSLGYHGVYLLCVAQDRAASFGHHAAYLLHVARDRAASLGYHGVYLLCVAQDRATSLGYHGVHLLCVAQDRAASLGHQGAHLLHVARDRATSLGHHGAYLLHVAQDRAAALGHRGAHQLRAGSSIARLAGMKQRVTGPRGRLTAWCREYSWRRQSRAWVARAGVMTLVLVTALPFALRESSHQRPPDPPVARSPQEAALRSSSPAPSFPTPVMPRQRAMVARPAAPAAPRVAPQSPDTPRVAPQSPEVVKRHPESEVLPSPQEESASRAVSRAPSPPVGPPDPVKERALLAAAKAGELVVVQLLLESGTSPSARDPKGLTPLMAATMRGDAAVVELLLDRGANVNARDDKGVTAVMLAARNGHAALLQRLLDRGAAVDARTPDGWTALTYAARKGYPDVARRLLGAGADPTLTDRSGWSPLMYASWRAAEINTDEPSASVEALDTRALASGEVARRRYNELVSLLSGATDKRR